MLHELEDDVDIILVVVQGFALNHLITVQVGDERGLIDDHLNFLTLDTFNEFHCKDFLITLALDCEDLAEATFINFFDHEVVEIWVSFLDFD